jgi:hypothetical protein
MKIDEVMVSWNARGAHALPGHEVVERGRVSKFDRYAHLDA